MLESKTIEKYYHILELKLNLIKKKNLQNLLKFYQHDKIPKLSCIDQFLFFRLSIYLENRKN